MKIKQSTFLFIIFACATMIFLMAIPEFVFNFKEGYSFTYLLTTEILALCLILLSGYYYSRTVIEEAHD